MDTKDFRSPGLQPRRDRASRFMDRFMACKGELVGHRPPNRTDTDSRAVDEPHEGSFVQLYMKAFAAARQ